MTFRNLEIQKLAPGKVVPLVLNQLAGEPVLHVEHLGESNTEFWNDAIAKAGTRASAGNTRRAVTAATIREARDSNRKTVAKYAVRGLENIVDDDGNAAGIAEIPAVVAALPDEVFDSVLAFCSNPENFRERSIDGNARELAGK